MHIIDTETASLQGGIVELAWLEVDKDLNILSEFRTLVNPERPIEPVAQAIHGISDDDVKDAPTIWGIPELAGIKQAVAHNWKFDQRMLGEAVQVESSLCTLALARRYIRGTTNHKLETLQRELGLPAQRSHSALGDVHTVRDLLLYLLPKTGLDIETLFDRRAEPKLLHRMPFGKHKSKRFDQIPPDYLDWLGSLPDLDKDLKLTLEHHAKLKT